MKKAAVWVLSIMFMSSGAFAAEKVGQDAEREAHRLQMKAIKQAQREAKGKEAPAPQGKAYGFWQREGERSGLGESTSSMGNFFKDINPVNFLKTQEDAYNARKGGVAAK